MLDTMTRYLAGVKDERSSWNLRKIIEDLIDRYSSQPLTSAGLLITTGGAATAKIGAADFYASVQGALVKIAASTNMPSLVGFNVPAADFNVCCFFVDRAGVVTMAPGTAAATLAGVVWPTFPLGKALVGCLLVTYASAFTGGTTALDTATTVYISPLGPFEPSCLV